MLNGIWAGVFLTLAVGCFVVRFRASDTYHDGLQFLFGMLAGLAALVCVRASILAPFLSAIDDALPEPGTVHDLSLIVVAGVSLFVYYMTIVALAGALSRMRRRYRRPMDAKAIGRLP